MSTARQVEKVPAHGEIPLSRPDVSEMEIDLVGRVLRSSRLSIGPVLEHFENLVAVRAGCRHGVGVSSGTSGLDLVMRALGIGPGDEVITTPFSFIASSNCILFVGATPVFVDICPKTLNMDPAQVERAITRKTKAILAVEALGNPAYMDAYASIAAKHEIPLIEDCCEALGTTYKGRPCGSFGRVGVFGFYPNKQITTGEGGMIVTDDARIADLCRSMRSQGRAVASDPAPAYGGHGGAGAGGSGGANVGSWLHHVRLGFNYRMSEINAALGVGQMRRLDEILKKRQMVADRYMRRLMGAKDLVLPTLLPESDVSWFVFVVRLAAGYTQLERDRIVAGLRSHDIGSADYFPCIHLQPFYRERFGFGPGMFPIAESVSQRTIALPFFNDLGEADQDLVCKALEIMVARENLSRG